MDGMNIDNDMLNNLKGAFGENQVNDALSQISPEMIDQFSKMMQGNSGASNNENNWNNNSSTESGFGDIDMATILKFKSVFDKMNSNKNDPRNNLLNSLKPYLRESKRENLDKYAQMLKMADIASLLNNEGKDRHD